MRPEDIREMVELAVRAFKAGDIGQDALIKKRNGEAALTELTIMVLTDIHRTADALERIASANTELLDTATK